MKNTSEELGFRLLGCYFKLLKGNSNALAALHISLSPLVSKQDVDEFDPPTSHGV
jgi:hypothetical protein